MISVVLAIRNESHNLRRCLESVKKFADEIIVVDGESTDDSVEVARSLGAKVIKATHQKNFHINKQKAMDAAKGELILQLDADEVVDKELAAFITTLHRQRITVPAQALTSKTEPVAWWIKRKNLFLGAFLKKGGQYPDPVIRLYLNGFAKLPQKDVHEQMKVDGHVGWAEGHLIHYSNPTFQEYLRKFNVYTSFKADQLFHDQVSISFSSAVKHLFWLPLTTFFLLYFRHKGFVDGVPGFMFAYWSALHHVVAYLKLWEKYQTI